MTPQQEDQTAQKALMTQKINILQSHKNKNCSLLVITKCKEKSLVCYTKLQFSWLHNTTLFLLKAWQKVWWPNSPQNSTHPVLFTIPPENPAVRNGLNCYISIHLP
jgi:hypothetical protein